MKTATKRAIKSTRIFWVVCHECGKIRQHNGRGLCVRCSKIPGVRERYPQHRVQQHNPMGISRDNDTLPDPPFPMITDDRERRITVMRRRAMAGYGVFHPDDSKSPDWFRWIDSINQQMDEASYGDD